MKLDRWRPRITADQLVCVCGLKRSGLHAISFWLLGHTSPHALVNNSPQKRPGAGSPMSRTIQTSPLPVQLRRIQQVSVYQDGVEQSSSLPRQLKLLLVVFQSQHLWHLQQHHPLVRGVEAKSTTTILLLRDPFNWAASYVEKSRRAGDADVWPVQWHEYAHEYVGATRFLPEAIRVNYNRWFVDRQYRQQLSAQLGFVPSDAALNIVTPHAGGSSFDQTRYSGRAQEMPVLERWKRYEFDPAYRDTFRRQPQILDLAEAIFDLPEDLRAFVAACRQP